MRLLIVCLLCVNVVGVRAVEVVSEDGTTRLIINGTGHLAIDGYAISGESGIGCPVDTEIPTKVTTQGLDVSIEKMFKCKSGLVRVIDHLAPAATSVAWNTTITVSTTSNMSSTLRPFSVPILKSFRGDTRGLNYWTTWGKGGLLSSYLPLLPLSLQGAFKMMVSSQACVFLGDHGRTPCTLKPSIRRLLRFGSVRLVTRRPKETAPVPQTVCQYH